MSDSSKKDRVFVGPSVCKGKHLYYRESADRSECSIGTLSSSIEALGSSSSLVQLEHVENNEFLVKEETRFNAKGPAQVATRVYRDNWDGIFGSKPQVGLA